MKTKVIMKKDSRRKSIIEVTTDVVLGCAIATGLNYTILPHYIETIQSGEPIGMLTISFWYVAASFIRKYLIRRWFVNMKRRTTPFREICRCLSRLKP